MLLPILLLTSLSPCPQTPTARQATELNAPAIDDAIDLRQRLMQRRSKEARAKALLAARLGRQDALNSPNQDLYDVQHYTLDLTLNPTSQVLSGTVTIVAEVVGGSLSTMDLDLTNDMTVSAATSGGTGVSTSHAGDLVTVTLDRTYATGETVTVTVTYSGDPAGPRFGWSSYSGDDMIWTLSEPYGAREWWPCKDQNTDKADSVDLWVTVPDHLIVASNGLMLSDVDNGATRTFHWQTNYPITTYLVSLAIHPYTRFSHSYPPLQGGAPMPVQYFVYPDHYNAVQTNYALVVPMLQVFAGGFGEYPFVDEKYGHAEFVWGGGMEHQTLSSMGGYSEDLISHELAHQWWGDCITCADFGHIWLNEGFATWSEAYWKEQTDSFATYQAYMDAAAYLGSGTIIVEDPSNFGDIFVTNLSYNKASWVVHMLRGVVGDTDFFDGLAQYRANHEYGTATTEDLRDAMEAVSGVELDAFFDDWIYGEYFPVYQYGWSQQGAAVQLTIDQVQTNTDLFTLPIDVRVVTTTGTQDFVVQNSLAHETYSLPITGQAQTVTLDPDKWILKQVETSVSNPTFDRGVLLVNGVDWNTYGSEIYDAYAAGAFWGDDPITFWDCFAEPAGGYPPNLPAPLGHDYVPGDQLGQFSTVIWVGNDYNGDLADWEATPIQSYLDAGGNVLLMGRRSSSFCDTELSNYLGVSWNATDVTLDSYTAQYTGLVNVTLTGTQSFNDTFSPSVGAQSTLLFRDTVGGGARGVGVHAHPTGGGSFRSTGGHFVLLAGRPYRMNATQLSANVDFLLSHFFGEPYEPPTAGPEKRRAGGRTLTPVSRQL